MNNNEISVYEFFSRITYDEHFKLSDSEMYSYIKHKTDNFDFETCQLFIIEINRLSGSICFIPPEIFKNENKNEETTLLGFFEKHILRHAHKNHLNKCKDLSDDELLSSIRDFDTKLGKYAHMFIDEYDAKMKMMEIQNYFKEYDFDFFHRYSQIIRFADILTTTYIRLFEQLPSSNKIPKLDIENNQNTQKQPVNFSGLFNGENIETEKIKLRNVILSDTDEKTAEQINKVNLPQPFENYLKKEQRHKSGKLIGLIKNRLEHLKDIDIARIIHLIKELGAFEYSTDTNFFISLCSELKIKVVESTKELDPDYQGRHILKRTISSAKGDTNIMETKLKENIIKLLQEKSEQEK